MNLALPILMAAWLPAAPISSCLDTGRSDACQRLLTADSVVGPPSSLATGSSLCGWVGLNRQFSGPHLSGPSRLLAEGSDRDSRTTQVVQPKPSARWARTIGIGVAVVTLPVLGAAVGYSFEYQSLRSQLGDVSTIPQYAQLGIMNRANRAGESANVLFAIGGGMLSVGTALILYDLISAAID